ncbi:MAG: mandelate racemase/muconate lactonizing enzyme family protein, partial [Acidimicrobiia bacterium]
MRIVQVEPIPLSYPEPNDFDAMRHICLVRVTTDEGIIGWGEAITQFPEANAAVAALIAGLEELIVGRDPIGNRAVVGALKDRAWWYGYGGGMASYAIAAIDIALWDIKGQALGVSVCELLGGPVHERLPAIASSHAHYEDIGAMAEEAEGWMAQGFQGMKVGFGKRGNARLGYEHDRDVEYVQRMRQALGPGRDLMIDIGIAIKWDVATAVRRVKAFEESQICWIEEPLGAWDPEGYRKLRASTNTLVAYGEKEWTVEGYERILETGTVDVLGIDPGRAEGISEFMKIADRAQAYNRQTNAHAWSSAIVTAASLATSFATPTSRVIEFKPLPNPMQDELVVEAFTQTDGWVDPPTGKPGLGIVVVDEVLDRYRTD